MSVDDILLEFESSLDDAIEALGREFAKLRTGRASPSLLDDVRAEVYGSVMPINQLATVSTPEPRTIRIAPFDPKSLEAIEKAIQKSGLGLTPNSDGRLIHINIPPLTEERRKDYVKQAGRMTEDCRVSQRNARHKALDALKKMEKDKSLSQDDHKKAAERVQKLIDDYGKKVDAILAKKEKEILEV